MEPVPAVPDRQHLKSAGMPLDDIIDQLTEIRQLVGDGVSSPHAGKVAKAKSVPDASLPGYLKIELEAIKSLCQAIPPGNESQHDCMG